MNKKIAEAVARLVELGYITINESLQEGTVALVIRDHISHASFKDVMDFFNNP
jgi:hypothetical protein